MAFTMLCLSACSTETEAPGRLALEPEIGWQEGRLWVVSGVVFEPGDEVREALERGVRLRLEVVTRLSRRIGPIALESAATVYPLDIGYLPLTEEWLLETPTGSERFPRLWLLLEALRTPRRFDTGLKADAIGTRNWQVQVRIRLDRDALPSPMHLPALLSPQWRLDSRWHSWQFEAS